MLNLPANIETISNKELMELTGQSQPKMGLGLPSLRVNYDDEDENENKIPRGEWSLYTGGHTIYAKTVLFQPILKTYQYSHFDNKEMKMVSTSIHFNNFGDEVPDDAGGFKCGKLPKKAVEKLSEAEQKVQKDIKLAQVFFGFTTIEGVNEKGEKAKAENVPSVFYAKGTHYMPMSELLEAMTKANELMQATIIKLDLKREKNGGVTYWEAVPAIVERVTVTKDTFAKLREFSETVKAENSQIIDKWSKVRSKRGTEETQKGVVEKLTRELDDTLDGSPLGKEFA
jgi:hypothetical protein